MNLISVGTVLMTVAIVSVLDASEKKERARSSSPTRKLLGQNTQKISSNPPAYNFVQQQEIEPTVVDDGNVFIASIPGKHYGQQKKYSDVCINLPRQGVYGMVSVDGGELKRKALELGCDLEKHYVECKGQPSELFATQLAPDALANIVVHLLKTHVVESLCSRNKRNVLQGVDTVSKIVQGYNPLGDAIVINMVNVSDDRTHYAALQVGTGFGAYLVGDDENRFTPRSVDDGNEDLRTVNSSWKVYWGDYHAAANIRYLLLKSNGCSHINKYSLPLRINDAINHPSPKEAIISLMKSLRDHHEKRYDFEVKQLKEEGVCGDSICAEIQDSTIMYIPLVGRTSGSSSSKDSK